ncbi:MULTISPECIES: hypothetical protein [Neisseriaceae]|uniref:Uncharacterized protein n=1 Tax=Morococcus cerebrosus TaxID=1056807 RepID=A0A0C1GPX7_9NEIS|nr:MULTISPECIES: hypothetical protein [Neisseriaceae]KIC07441.1 hypothetical protein MCC93_13730 [Morococcus cerebrosus]OFJ62172.1 hypothetical protein HMPREF2858_04705 [Neisseria sp. HMSC073B07]UNV87985.1 hypothetical protein MON37_03360 [Morococcus cerebrosus]
MTRQVFILGDQPLPEGSSKPYALLTANPTKEHHYIAQTEQRQHAHNPQVSPQNQNVYRLPLSLFGTHPHQPHDERKKRKHAAKPAALPEVASVNIIGNLAAKNLYTLTFVENTGNQYNLESWFNRHESGYEDACEHLRTLPGCRLKTSEASFAKTSRTCLNQTDSVKVPDALWRVLRLKFLGILRNPRNHQNPFAYRLLQVLRSRLPEAGFEFVSLISRRDPKRIESIMQDFHFSFLGYVNWLSGLYGMLSEGVSQPSLFERLFCAVFAEPQAVKIELFRYPDDTGLCLFGDSGFCLQASSELISIGVNISHDMFAVVHLQAARWHDFKNTFHHDAPKLQGKVKIIDGDQTQRVMFNRLCIRQSHEAVFGRSPNVKDYI